LGYLPSQEKRTEQFHMKSGYNYLKYGDEDSQPPKFDQPCCPPMITLVDGEIVLTPRPAVSLRCPGEDDSDKFYHSTEDHKIFFHPSDLIFWFRVLLASPILKVEFTAIGPFFQPSFYSSAVYDRKWQNGGLHYEFPECTVKPYFWDRAGAGASRQACILPPGV
jgi:hypothetical protein